MRSDIYEQTIQVLTQCPVEATDALNRVKRYEDSKISVVGLLPLDIFTKDYESVVVLVKLPGTQTNAAPFSIPRRDEMNGTVAYYAQNGIGQFYRPGKWEIHLKNLATKIETEREAIWSLNEQPLDDDGVFPDL